MATYGSSGYGSGGYGGGGSSSVRDLFREIPRPKMSNPGRAMSGVQGMSAGVGRMQQPAPAPAPVMQTPQPYMGRIQTNRVQPQGATPMPAATQPQGQLDQIRSALGGAPAGGGGGLQDQLAKMPWDQQVAFKNFSDSLYANPDYQGRHEAIQMLQSAYLRMLQRRQQEAPIDFSGSSEVADQFGNQREQLMNALAARGISGSGVEAGALANSYGNEARAMGSFYRDAQEQRRREKMAEDMAFENWVRQTMGQGLQRNYAEQDAPGFWDKALGVVGNVAGAALPGIGGAAVKGVTGLFGGGQPAYPTAYGPGYGYGGGTDYPPIDWNDPYYTGVG